MGARTCSLNMRPELAFEVERTIEQQPGLRDLVHSAEIRTSVGLLISNCQEVPQRRGELFDAILRMLLGFPLRPYALKDPDLKRIEFRLAFLEDVAWSLATSHGSDRTYFGSFQTCDLIRQMEMTQSKWQPSWSSTNLSELFGDLMDQGTVLRKTGIDHTICRFAQSHYPAYLVARRMATMSEGELLRWIRHDRADYFDDWSKVTVFLASILEKPSPIIEAIIEAPNRPYQSYDKYDLAGRCISAAYPTNINDELTNQIIDELLSYLKRTRGHFEKGNLQERIAATAVLGLLPGTRGIRGLRKALRTKNKRIRSAAIESLSRIRSPVVIPDLLHVLYTFHRSFTLRRVSARALALIGGTEATKALRAALWDDDYLVALTAYWGLKLNHPSKDIEKELQEFAETRLMAQGDGMHWSVF